MQNLTSKLRSRKNILLGQIEQIILLAILHRSNHAYSIDINDEIERRTGIKLTVGAMYSTLDRMVKKDLITCIDVDNEVAQNSRSRRYFSVTTRGRHLLHESIDIARKMQERIDILAIPVCI